MHVNCLACSLPGLSVASADCLSGAKGVSHDQGRGQSISARNWCVAEISSVQSERSVMALKIYMTDITVTALTCPLHSIDHHIC